MIGVAVGLHEGDDLGICALVREVVGEVASLHGRTTDRDEFRTVPSITTDEGDGDAELAGLTDDEGGLGVVGGEEDHVGIARLDRGELGTEVLVTAGVALLPEDRAAGLYKLLLEAPGKTEAVVLGDIGQNGGLGGPELAGELRADRSLKGIDEANAEDMVTRLGHLLVRRGGGDHRDAAALGDRGGLKRTAGGHFADKGHDLVTGDEFAHGRRSLTGLGLVVLGSHAKGLAQHATGVIDLLEGESHPLVGALSEGRLRPGKGGKLSDLNTGFLPFGARRRGEQRGKEKKGGYATHHAVTLGSHGLRAKRGSWRKRHGKDLSSGVASWHLGWR